MKIPVWLFLILLPACGAFSSDLVIDPSELAVFMDGVMNEQMIAYEIPGAVVSVVKDGEIIFSRGYGYADIGERTPATPDSSLFRIGSVSKLFVWTSVMQLVEEGELDLYADVNSYLTEFQIPGTFEEPITLAHLLTHTPGFEEQELGVFVADSSLVEPLCNYLEDNMPVRVRAPGELSSYSNYGTALAAYIVQEKSGLPFDEYVARNICQPLGMTMSSFRQPPPGEESQLVTGYVSTPGRQIPQAFEWVQAYPAGSMCSTAEDMARFMIAHLQNGVYMDQRILADETAMDMHGLHFTHDSLVNGWTWGFMQLNMGEDSLIWHGGDTYFFHSALYLLPGENTGLFVAYNCPAGAKARIDLVKVFLEHYKPREDVSEPVPRDGADHALRCAGYYLDIRSNSSTPEKLMTLLSPHQVEYVREKTLLFAGNQWVETAPMVFRNVTSPEVIVFIEDSAGNVERLFRGNNPTTAYVRLPWLISTPVQRTFVSVAALIFASVTVIWFFGLAAGLFQRKRHSAGEAVTGVILWVVCSANAVFLAWLYRMLSEEGFGLGLPSGIEKLLLIPWATAPLTAVLVVLLVFVWKEGLWRLPARLHFTLAVVASGLLVWWMHYWNLLFYSF